MAAKEHAREMLEVLTGKPKYVREAALRSMFEELSTTIDNFEVIKGVPIGKGEHRVYGHWGFAGSIPFNEEPLKGILGKLDSAARKEAKNRISNAWKKDVNKLIKTVREHTGLPRTQAKGLAGLFYDIHLLGDWKTTKVDALQKPRKIKADILKNLHRLLGNRSNLVNEIGEELKQALKHCTSGDEHCEAKEIVEVLKKSDQLREKLADLVEEKAPLLAKALRSNAVWKTVLTIYYAHERLLGRLPQSLKVPVKAGTLTALLSGLQHTWNFLNDEEEAVEALVAVTQDTALTITSLYIAEGMIQSFEGGKYALTVIMKEGVSESAKQMGVFLNYGVATFIFDDTINVYYYLSSELSTEEFIEETGKSFLKATASGTATYCAVMLGASPGGPVVIAISIGTYVAVSIGIQYAEMLDERNYFFIEDALGNLPLSMQNKITPFSAARLKDTPFNIDHKKITPFSNNIIKRTPFDEEVIYKTTPFNTQQ